MLDARPYNKIQLFLEIPTEACVFNAIKDLSNYGISEANYAEEGYKTFSTTKMDAHGNLQILFNNQNGTVLPTGIILAGSGMGIIVALVIALGWIVKIKFIK